MSEAAYVSLSGEGKPLPLVGLLKVPSATTGGSFSFPGAQRTASEHRKTGAPCCLSPLQGWKGFLRSSAPVSKQERHQRRCAPRSRAGTTRIRSEAESLPAG